MCYDDHNYCEVCGRHSIECYCFTYMPPDPDEDVCRDHAD